MALSGPVIGRWHKYLEHKFPLRTRREGATNFVSLAKRVAVDQIIMAPIGVGPAPKFMRPSSATLTVYATHSFPSSSVPWASWKAATQNISVPDSRTSIVQRCWPTGRYGLLRRFVVNPTFHKFRHLLTDGVGVVRQFINFWLMPLPYRVPFQQTCGVFWTLYLSLLNAA
jgi:protein Mpv17